MNENEKSLVQDQLNDINDSFQSLGTILTTLNRIVSREYLYRENRKLDIDEFTEVMIARLNAMTYKVQLLRTRAGLPIIRG